MRKIKRIKNSKLEKYWLILMKMRVLFVASFDFELSGINLS